MVLVLTRRFGSEWNSATFCWLMFLLGLGCYLYLPIASMTNPPINWGYPRTIEGFFHAITRGQYEGYHPSDDLGRFVLQLWVVAKQTCDSLGWPYFMFMPLPFFLLRRTHERARNWLLVLVAVFVCVGPLVVALLNPSMDLASMDFIASFLAPMSVVLAVWTGLGLMIFGSLVSKPRAYQASGTASAC